MNENHCSCSLLNWSSILHQQRKSLCVGRWWKGPRRERLCQVEIRSGAGLLFCQERCLRWIERGRWIIKEVCSVLTRSLCSQYLHFAVSCSPVTVWSFQFYSHVPVCWLHCSRKCWMPPLWEISLFQRRVNTLASHVCFWDSWRQIIWSQNNV